MQWIGSSAYPVTPKTCESEQVLMLNLLVFHKSLENIFLKFNLQAAQVITHG